MLDNGNNRSSNELLRPESDLVYNSATALQNVKSAAPAQTLANVPTVFRLPLCEGLTRQFDWLNGPIAFSHVS